MLRSRIFLSVLVFLAAMTFLVSANAEPARAARPEKRTSRFTAADFSQHVAQLKKKVPEGFTVLVRPPFVVLGDEDPATVRHRAEQTVQWAVDKLRAAYFDKDPEEILDIWLFKDKESYEKHCRAIFKHRPSTPYGFFSSSDGALVMNIATGGGTLVHEIVHPFIAANFPQCPAWFNEGLASLYEQSGERAGQIIGYTNWRLAGLQKAIRAKRLPSFAKLCNTTERQFRDEDEGTNYAQARYLCYYLQEEGLLQKFYHEFVKNHEHDPGGYEILKRVLGRDDMDAFQKQWESYVLRLQFP